MELPESGYLRSRVRSGLGWKLFTQVVSQVARFFVALLIARLLSPHAYGVAALALVFAELPTLFIDFSLGAALIQRRDITETDLSTVFWVSLASGLAVTASCVVLSPVIASFFSEPQVKPLFAVMSISFTLYGVGTVPYALLNRQMAFRTLELREVSATLVAGIAGVFLALGGFGAWAIVSQSVVGDVIATIFIWRVVHWHPRARFSLQSLRTLGSFGTKMFAARLLGYLNANGDNLLIGRFLGANALGVYAIAYNLIFSPLTRVTRPIQQVLFPAMAQIQDDRRRLANAWLSADRLLSVVAVPAFLGMAAVAPDFVSVVLGRKWHDAAPVVQLLSVAATFQILQAINPNVLQAIGQAGIYLRYMVGSSILTVGAFVVGLHWGVVGVAACFAIVRPPLVIVSICLTGRAVGVSFWRWARELMPAFQIGVVMSGIVYGARVGLVHGHVGALATLLTLVALGLTIYLALLYAWARPLIADARLLVKG